MLSPQSQRLELADGGLVELRLGWVAEEAQAALFARLEQELDWAQRPIRIAGREVLQPRLTAWYGDPGAAYTYSGLSLEPRSWHPCLSELRSRLEAETPHRFNSVLTNLYRNGGDSMGFHADKETELGRNPAIASVSLGSTRRFVMRHRKQSVEQRVELDLPPGSLLLMTGTTQHFWRHSVPKIRGPSGARINLTYRLILSR